MATQESLDSCLEHARKLHELRCLLSDAYRERNISIDRAFSEWIGEAADEMRQRNSKDIELFWEAIEVLKKQERVWIDRWVRYSDLHNESVRNRAIQSLQAAIDSYYEAKRQEMNRLRAGLDAGIGLLDDAVDTVSFGHFSIRPDDAPQLVPVPHVHGSVEDVNLRPVPPHYVVEGKPFVRYERRNNADPTAGMYDCYQEWPA